MSSPLRSDGPLEVVSGIASLDGNHRPVQIFPSIEGAVPAVKDCPLDAVEGRRLQGSAVPDAEVPVLHEAQGLLQNLLVLAHRDLLSSLQGTEDPLLRRAEGLVAPEPGVKAVIGPQ